jgi:phytoene dehydrogenase-like protein
MALTYDVVVIGAGHNGLVSACYLARAGLDVLVVEAGPTVGGMTSTTTPIEEAPHHRINMCAVDVAFLRGTNIVRELQLRRFGYREIDLDPAYVYLHSDGESLALWRDPRQTATEIRKFSTHDADAYLTLVRHLDAVLQVAQPLMATNPCHPRPGGVARAATIAARRRTDLRGAPSLVVSSAAEAIDERFHHPFVRDAIGAMISLWDSPSRIGSAYLLMFLAVCHRFGVGRLVGGTQTLPDSLVGALRSLGGAVRCEAKVQEILVSGDRATGVRLASGEELVARKAVIATCDPRTALGKLLPTGCLDPTIAARVAHIPSFSDGAGFLVAHFALSGQLRLERHERLRQDGLDLRKPIHFMGGLDPGVASYSEAQAGRFPVSPPFGTIIPTAVDPSQAPPGQDTFYLLANAAPLNPEVSWASLKPVACKALVAHAAEYFDGLEELEIGRIEETPEDLADRLNVTNGNWMHVDTWRIGPFRPAPGLSGYRTPIAGLYLGGCGSHPGPGMSGLPGRNAAQEVLRRPRRFWRPARVGAPDGDS